MSPPGELVLIANARLPSARAQSLQVMQAASAYARQGVPTTLMVARRRPSAETPEVGDLHAWYGVPEGPRASLAWIPCHDWVDVVPRTLQYAPARLQELSFARNAARAALREHPGATVLSRELEAGRHLTTGSDARVFLEIHRVPGGATRRRWLLEAARGVRGILAISGGVREDLLALGIAEDAVRVEHDGFEATRFSAPLERLEARAALGLDPHGPLVAYTGGLLDWKGVDVLVEAARRLPRVRFVVAGGMEADLERVRSQARGLPNVRLDGFQPPARVPVYLAAADLVAVPNRSRPAISARYTSPLKVFEAMAAGCAVVASDLPSLRELLSHGRDAWLVPPDDPAALAEGLERVLDDAPLRSRLAAALSSRVAEHTWDARAHRILAWMAQRG